MVRSGQPLKAEENALGGVEDCILMPGKPEQPAKADSPMVVTELGIVIEVKPLQYSKALIPMLVTELGIAMEVKREH